MVQFSKMNGYEFEDYIGELFRKMGFSVEPMPYSGDGGIDLIAICNKPIYKGKYVIQCKKWTEPVGQPSIRDLYGAVMSENANKGILITTSSFSEQAFEFAKGKNIELIDGDGLEKLINSISCEARNQEVYEVTNERAFLNAEGFNKKKYLYYKQRLEQNRENVEYSSIIFKMLREYIFAGKYIDEYGGILDEYIELKDFLRKNSHKGKRNQLSDKVSIAEYSFYYILKGDFVKAFEIIVSVGYGPFNFRRFHGEVYFREIYSNELQPYFVGLFSLFYRIGNTKACEYIKQNYFPKDCSIYLVDSIQRSVSSYALSENDTIEIETVINCIDNIEEKSEALSEYIDTFLL